MYIYLHSVRYGDVLALLGRELRDFLNGLDNLHEYLKFSYPRWSFTFNAACVELNEDIYYIYSLDIMELPLIHL